MLDQLVNLVKQFGQDTVVDNPEVPNEYNQEVMADATKTIASGFQNVMAGGGFQNILDLFKGGSSSSSGNGIGGLLKNPMVTMMIGYFANKLMSKYRMNSSSASNLAGNLIPNVLNGLINKTVSHAPENDAFDFNDLIGSLTGGNVATSESSGGGFNFQGLLDQFVGGGGSAGAGGNGFDLQDIISKVTRGTQQNQQQSSGGGGGIMDLIKGFIS